MKHLITAGLLSLLSAGTVAAGPATAPSPLGEWRVKDGTADIRIVNCNGGLWGVISWVQGDPGKDTNNPDPSLRERSMMGRSDPHQHAPIGQPLGRQRLQCARRRDLHCAYKPGQSRCSRD